MESINDLSYAEIEAHLADLRSAAKPRVKDLRKALEGLDDDDHVYLEVHLPDGRREGGTVTHITKDEFHICLYSDEEGLEEDLTYPEEKAMYKAWNGQN